MQYEFEGKKIKFKLLSKAQLLISLDRLTRFKNPEDKYLRVFKEILLANLIQPKFNKQKLDEMSYEQLRDIAQEIINSSIYSYSSIQPSDFSINDKIFEYENSVFLIDSQTQSLLTNRIAYKEALALFETQELPLNLKWLKSLSEASNQKEMRESFSLKFPIEKVIIAEGITEEILLPKFAHFYGYNFDKKGVMVVSAGGKNQVVKLFYKYAELLKIPIFVLLDSDATENYSQIKPKLRAIDKVHVIKRGEFEDILSLNLIKRTLNKVFRNFSSVSISELRQNIPMTKVLEQIYKQKSTAEYKKAEFAALLSNEISSKKDLSPEIIDVLEEIESF